MTQNNNIWVFAQHDNQNIDASTFELLGKAQSLNEKQKAEVVAILLQTPDQDFSKALIAHGADKVITIKDDAFKTYNPVLYKDAIVTIAEKYDPSIFLFAATFMGRSLAPRVQGALKTGLTADCLDLDIDDEGKLLQIKPSYGDNLMCTIIIPNARPQMTTVRPHVFTPLASDENRVGTVVEEKVNLKNDMIYEVLETEEIIQTADDITEANTIVAIGRGLVSKDNLPLVEDLAEKLNAKIGVTRPLAENGWYTVKEQIGQSGVNVQPELILNLGIAGAVQYTVGMKNAKFSFSVNKDEHASIFKESDYGYVGDAKAFTQALLSLLNK